jgi:hypothetical protein
MVGERLAKVMKEKELQEDSDEEGANQRAQQKKLLAHDDSDSDDHPEGLDAHCEVDIFVMPTERTRSPHLPSMRASTHVMCLAMLCTLVTGYLFRFHRTLGT